jgi:chemotaxis protein CheC
MSQNHLAKLRFGEKDGPQFVRKVAGNGKRGEGDNGEGESADFHTRGRQGRACNESIPKALRKRTGFEARLISANGRMELTATHQDALTELINIGYGRAAASLSQLTRRRISLEVPKVAIYEIDKASTALREIMQGEVASVHQIFSGAVSGHALLLLDRQAALTLNSLLIDEKQVSGELHEAEREVLTEVGNILLNACLGVFGNVLQVQMTFSVPRFHVDSVEDVLQTATVHSRELQYALMIHTRFHVRTSNVVGYMMMILGVTSMSRLKVELDKWEHRQFSS